MSAQIACTINDRRRSGLGTIETQPQRLENGLTIAFDLRLADTSDLGQNGHVPGLSNGDFQQGLVLKNDIGRHALFGGAVAAPGAKGLEPGTDVGIHGLQRGVAARASALAGG